MSDEKTLADLVAPDPEFDPRIVRLDDCLCPGGEHGAEGDTITLRPTLDYGAVRAIRYAGQIARDDDPDTSIVSLMAAMSEQFLLHGVESWTLQIKGKPIEIEKATIRRYLLSNMTAAMIAADHADILYQAQVLHPLAELAKRSLQPTPTNGSTSLPNGHASRSQAPTDGSNGKSSNRSGKRPKPSKRSLTTTTPTVSTVATTFDSAGDSTS